MAEQRPDWQLIDVECRHCGVRLEARELKEPYRHLEYRHKGGAWQCTVVRNASPPLGWESSTLKELKFWEQFDQ